jgi:HEAT repeat protein
MSLSVAAALALAVALYGVSAVAQMSCPTTPSELEEIIDNEADPAVRAEAAECFVEKAIDLTYQELKPIVHKMLKDEASAEVRFNGLAMLGASLMAGQSTGFDITGSKAKIIQILNEDPVGQNKAAAAALIAEMDPIPVNQVEEPLLDLLFHSDSFVVKIALGALLKFDQPPREEISQVLMDRMGHSDPRQRSVAGQGLGRLYRNDPSIDPAVVDALALALSDSDRHVKIQAANSLRMFGSQAASAAPDLNALVWDSKQPPDIRKAARKAEETITGEPTQPPWLTGETPPPEPGMAGAPD